MSANTSIHLRTFGRGDLGCRAANQSCTNTTDLFLKTFKKKPTVELYLSGRASPDRDAPVVWSVVAYGGTPEEIEWFKDNTVS